ncbi:hypothetical protein [Nonomuraea aurantiaca]|nr:hypothetical protein [Nonomuraea aurantiaca]MCA2224644.1 hypothetical protein [Nonomuraea aurantiaca]
METVPQLARVLAGLLLRLSIAEGCALGEGPCGSSADVTRRFTTGAY